MAVKKEKNRIPGYSETDFTVEKELTKEEFLEGIKNAENGPFYTVEESQNRFEKWLKEREKKS